jgi:hypothetical protein
MMSNVLYVLVVLFFSSLGFLFPLCSMAVWEVLMTVVLRATRGNPATGLLVSTRDTALSLLPSVEAGWLVDVMLA